MLKLRDFRGILKEHLKQVDACIQFKKSSLVAIAFRIETSAFPAPPLPLQPLSTSTITRLYLMFIDYRSA
jgi:hypothetical protein